MFGAIQSAPRWGKRPAMPRTSFAPTRRRRSPARIIFAIIALLILALLVYAWAKNKEVAPTRIEQDVTNELAH
jgi:sensor domain CHASE-containing protein